MEVSGSSSAAFQDVRSRQLAREISSLSYEEQGFLVIMGVCQLACSLPRGPKPQNGRECCKSLEAKVFLPFWMSGRSPAAFNEVQSCQMAMKSFSDVKARQIPLSFWVSSSSPAAFQEVRSRQVARKSFPKIIERGRFPCHVGCPAHVLLLFRKSRAARLPRAGNTNFLSHCTGSGTLAFGRHLYGDVVPVLDRAAL